MDRYVTTLFFPADVARFQAAGYTQNAQGLWEFTGTAAQRMNITGSPARQAEGQYAPPPIREVPLSERVAAIKQSGLYDRYGNYANPNYQASFEREFQQQYGARPPVAQAQVQEAQAAYAREYSKVAIPNPLDPLGYYKEVAYLPGRPALNLETLGFTGYGADVGEQIIGSIAGQHLLPEQVAILEKNPIIVSREREKYYTGEAVTSKGTTVSFFGPSKKLGFDLAPVLKSPEPIPAAKGFEGTTLIRLGMPVSSPVKLFGDIPGTWIPEKMPPNTFRTITGQYVSVDVGKGVPGGSEKVEGDLWREPPVKAIQSAPKETSQLQLAGTIEVAKKNIGTRTDIGLVPQERKVEDSTKEGYTFGLGWGQKVSEQLDILNIPIRKAEASRYEPFFGPALLEAGIVGEKIVLTAIPSMVDLWAELAKHPMEYGQQFFRASTPIIPFVESTHWGPLGLTTSLGEFSEKNPWISSGAGLKITAAAVWASGHPFETAYGMSMLSMTGKLISTSSEGIITGRAGLSVKTPVPKETTLEIGYGYAKKGGGTSVEGEAVYSRESMLRKALPEEYYSPIGKEQTAIDKALGEVGLERAKQFSYEYAENPFALETLKLGGRKAAVLEVPKGMWEVAESPTFMVRGEGLEALQVMREVGMFGAQQEIFTKIDTGELGGGLITLEKGRGMYTVSHEAPIIEGGITRAYRLPPKPIAEVLSTDTTRVFIQGGTSGKAGITELSTFRGGFGEPLVTNIPKASVDISGNIVEVLRKPETLGLKFSLEKDILENLFEEHNAATWVAERTLIGGGAKTPFSKTFPEFMDYALKDAEKLEYIPSSTMAGSRDMRIVDYTPSGKLVQESAQVTAKVTEGAYPIFSKTTVFDEGVEVYYSPSFGIAGKAKETPIMVETPSLKEIVHQASGTASSQIALPQIRLAPKTIELPKSGVEVLPIISVNLRPMDMVRQPSKVMDLSKTAELSDTKINNSILQPQMQVQLQKVVEITKPANVEPGSPSTNPPWEPPKTRPEFNGFEFKEKKQQMKSKILGEVRGITRGVPLPWADILSVQRTQARTGGRSHQPLINTANLERWTRAAGEGFMRGFPTQEMLEMKVKASGLDFLGKRQSNENLFGRKRKVSLW
jgi:hypothetical protein